MPMISVRKRTLVPIDDLAVESKAVVRYCIDIDRRYAPEPGRRH